MPLNPVPNIDLTASYGVKPQKDQKEVQQAGPAAQPDNDIRKEPDVKPTVNTNGESLGKIINTKA